jgi:hypothetical protein
MTYGLRINSSYLFVFLASLDWLIRTLYGVSSPSSIERGLILVTETRHIEQLGNILYIRHR